MVHKSKLEGRDEHGMPINKRDRKIAEAYNIITQFISDSDIDYESKVECNEKVNYLYDLAKGIKKE